MAPQTRRNIVNVVAIVTALIGSLAFAGPIFRAFDMLGGHPMDERYAQRDSVVAMIAALRAEQRAGFSALGGKIDRFADVLCDPKTRKPRVCSEPAGSSVVQAGIPNAPDSLQPSRP